MPKRTWLMFGNSFVQGPGHLADTAERALPDIRIFALRRQSELPLRAAEARLLLANGLRPERIFFVMFPIETLQIGRRPLSFIEVRPDGAIATRVRWPDQPWTSLVTSSRLATIAWIRSGRSAGDPSFDFRRVSGVPSPRVQADLSRILDHLGETSRRFNVPVTIVAVPDRDQILGRVRLRLPGYARATGAAGPASTISTCESRSSKLPTSWRCSYPTGISTNAATSCSCRPCSTT